MESKGYDADIAIKLLTGDPDTVKRLTRYSMDTYNNYLAKTNMGADDDATSLENMKLAFKYIRECNDLRIKGDPENGFDPQEPLLVNSALMAISQMNINFRKTNHSGMFDFRIGENVANCLVNPFRLWYDDEREQYMEFPGTSLAGHYKNIIDPDIVLISDSDGTYFLSYSITGFAVASGGGIPYAYCQDFSYLTRKETDNTSSLYGKSYSVDEYEALFNEYYDSLMNADAVVAECEKALQQAKEDLAAKEQNVLDAQAAVEQAEADLKAAKEELAVLQNELKDAQALRDEMQTAYDMKQEAVNQAKTSVDKASEKVSDAQAVFDIAAAETEKATRAYEEAESAAVGKNEMVSQASAAVEEARNALSELDQAVSAAADVLSQKEEAYEAARTAVEQAEETYENAQISYAEKSEAAEIAAETVKEKQQALEQAEAVYSEKAAAAQAAREEADEKRGKLDAVANAESALAAAKENVTVAIAARDNAVAKYEQLQKTVSEKEETLKTLAKKSERAQDLTYEEALEGQIEDEEFAYLNTYFDAVRSARAELETAETALSDALAQQEKDKAALDMAKKEYAAAVAAQAVAEVGAEAGEQETADNASEVSIVPTDNRSEEPKVVLTTAPQTGDNTFAAGWLGLAAVSALAAGAVTWKKRKSE